ncbi:amino acid permease [Apilactobacillus micheneri]|uniref:Amino acid permease n=1 Tax=Apilactobacillus micheneri TaxID=1899430 RepID=A0ABY2Z067_9LACO|nr:APC family permease [Apilactobacillus micheneri]TPR26204.1 amino acid permease [Apilactobacillus micheneri]TPR26958.1 amino acid permease [Apilactobacillus micheneri]TPR27816.1 amino acid permease [Apilactobacillus micheneri]TPR31721.1 amino acid permease [Apilactobacillus micheneri]TPR32125.1 amino acid permease [Apilactobacillus micheneri]
MPDTKKKLSFFSIVLLGINAIIGSGIFLLPTAGMKIFGPASILVLVFDAFLAFMIGLCFAECSGLFDESGGAYIYAKHAFGNFIGYEVGIAAWAVRIIAEATMYVAFATALGGFFPALNTSLAKNIIVTIMAVGLMILNLSGIEAASVFSNIITVGKLLPIFLIIIIGLFFIHPGNFTPFFVPSLTHASNFSDATLTMFYIFTGVEGLVVTAGEMSNVKKNLPRAIMVVLSVVTIIYILIMTVCIGVLGTKLTQTSVPLQAALTAMIGKVGSYIVVAGSVLSIGGICIASSFITPRSTEALADNGILPKAFSKKNRKNAPYISIIVNAILILALSYSGTFTYLAQISAISRFAQFIPTIIAVMVFRKTMKNKPRAFKLPLGYTIPIIALAISLWLIFNTKVNLLIFGFGALVVALPFYFLTRGFRERKIN